MQRSIQYQGGLSAIHIILQSPRYSETDYGSYQETSKLGCKYLCGNCMNKDDQTQPTFRHNTVIKKIWIWRKKHMYMYIVYKPCNQFA